MEYKKTRALSRIDEGETVTVVSVHGGRGLRSRLATMGLLPKVQIRVVRNGRFGPFVINVKNSRIAVGRGVADKIMVM